MLEPRFKCHSSTDFRSIQRHLSKIDSNYKLVNIYNQDLMKDSSDGKEWGADLG